MNGRRENPDGLDDTDRLCREALEGVVEDDEIVFFVSPKSLMRRSSARAQPDRGGGEPKQAEAPPADAAESE